MIIEQVYYRIKCDSCGKLSGEGDEISAWDNKGVLLGMYEYWEHIEGQDYCPECWTWDSEGENIIPQPISEE